MTEKPLINKVAQKAIITLDPVSLLPKATEIVAFDVKGFLYKELVLIEKTFRVEILSYPFDALQNKSVYLYCSNMAIVPMWAYMLLASHLQKMCKHVVFADNLAIAEEMILLQEINQIETKPYLNQRIVIKGCGEKAFSPNVYMALVQKLQPIAKSIAFGESCSMVPIVKN